MWKLTGDLLSFLLLFVVVLKGMRWNRGELLEMLLAALRLASSTAILLPTSALFFTRARSGHWSRIPSTCRVSKHNSLHYMLATGWILASSDSPCVMSLTLLRIKGVTSLPLMPWHLCMQCTSSYGQVLLYTL